MAHTFNKVVFGKLFPSALNVRTIQDVLKEAATAKTINKIYQHWGRIESLDLRCKGHSIDRVEVINGTTPLAQVHAGLDTYLDIPYSTANGSHHVLTHG